MENNRVIKAMRHAALYGGVACLLVGLAGTGKGWPLWVIIPAFVFSIVLFVLSPHQH